MSVPQPLVFESRRPRSVLLPLLENARKPRSRTKSEHRVSLTPAQRIEKHSHSDPLRDFQFHEKVGRGAYADVYRAVNLRTGQVVAVKQIQLEKDHEKVLMGEIDLLKILKHENIVKYHGFVKTPTSLNVFLEFCAGGSLRQLYKRRGLGLPETEIQTYVKPILHGLLYLHEQGVVHRDVKAANVLITRLGEIKLADFGVATKVAALHNTVVGTPNWMAPETVLGGEGICTASDVWSLGATIIELFAANPPYHSLNAMATLHAIGTDDHPPLPLGLSPRGKDFLMECFQKQPTLRTSAELLLRHRWIERKAQPEPVKTEVVAKSPQKLTRAELLQKFSETSDEHIEDAIIPKTPQMTLSNEEDPFLNLPIEPLDNDQLEARSKMEHHTRRLNSRVREVKTEECIKLLIKTTARMLTLVKKHPVSHEVLIRDHGLLTLLELLEAAQELADQQQLWFQVLSVLNGIFKTNIAQLENFALLGGIPMFTQFSVDTNSLSTRLQVCRFVKLLTKSDRALLMFVSAGGLRVVARFLEEDFKTLPDFPIVAVHCIHAILARDLTRFKLDMCRMLSKYGVVFHIVAVLDQLFETSKIPVEYVDRTTDECVGILRFFSSSEPKVRVSISSPRLFKLLVKVYSSLTFPRQLVVLKFLRAISCVSDLLTLLHEASILEFFVELLKLHTPGTQHFKEVANVVGQALYNCCYLNHSKETELVRLGAVPLLRNMLGVNLEFRQFLLPIVCELVHCDKSVRSTLFKYNMDETYFQLLTDPYWHSNALDALIHWSNIDPSFHWLENSKAQECFKNGLILPKISNLEGALENYLVLLGDATARRLMTSASVIKSVLGNMKLNVSVVKVLVLRILRFVVVSDPDAFEALKIRDIVTQTLTAALMTETSVLVRELATKIMAVI